MSFVEVVLVVGLGDGPRRVDETVSCLAECSQLVGGDGVLHQEITCSL